MTEPETAAKPIVDETCAPTRVGAMRGYARISSTGPTLAAQRACLIQAGVVHLDCDAESKSGKESNRAGLARLLDHARPGDGVCITRLDRLGRSLREVLDTISELATRGLHLVSLEERLDTSAAAGEHVFHVFSVIAHCERAFVAERTREGIAAARKLGRKPGRPPLDPATAAAAKKLIEAGLSPGTVARQLGIGRSTAYRLAKRSVDGCAKTRVFGEQPS